VTSMRRQYQRVVIVWVLTLAALYLFQLAFGLP
jgi:hypothetical protein